MVLAATVLVFVSGGVAGWAFSTMGDLTRHPAASATPTPGHDPSGSLTVAVRHCRDAWRLQGSDLRAARASLDQWNLHVTAMNQLVAGEITVQRARQFWSNTRRGAKERLFDFHQADRRYTHADESCSKAYAVRAETTINTNLNHCATAMVSRDKVLSYARIALDTWQEHIQQMEAFSAGKVTPAQQSQMWVQMWHAGQYQMREYRDAINEAKDAACPLRP